MTARMYQYSLVLRTRRRTSGQVARVGKRYSGGSTSTAEYIAGGSLLHSASTLVELRHGGLDILHGSTGQRGAWLVCPCVRVRACVGRASGCPHLRTFTLSFCLPSAFW